MNITSVDQVIEIAVELAFGFFAGMSFSGDDTCATGLNAVVFYAYEVYNFREFYMPSNSMGFALASQKLTESYNSIYAFCDFDHLWKIVTQLISFTDFTALGQLG
eukprot:CAMPEP_0202968518 /NCGR_PEP_ID=MMETSP1396-20130829/13863_1 /ASSEMBLY_ACC=CAM_ASM_000872 /TAXON_ID= /ORGANISM="Pseudokeronopsis sp., Strain Brazil" /LENGTH=104 /DNA_ID=CAMNT_0049694937 /DNA_START=223 /DNA_END=533 /DNA_ORIENTATION=-